jgi:hypothetical protein
MAAKACTPLATLAPAQSVSKVLRDILYSSEGLYKGSYQSTMASNPGARWQSQTLLLYNRSMLLETHLNKGAWLRETT